MTGGRLWRLVALAACSAPPAVAQQAAPADPRRFLGAYVDLQVLDESGSPAAASPRLIRRVDVNGAIRLRFRHDAFNAFEAVRPGSAGDTSARRLTLALLTDLETYAAVADSLVRAAALGRAAFKAAADRADRWYGDYTDHVVEYFTLRANREQPETDPRLTAARLANPYLGRERMPAFVSLLRQDLQRLFREAAAATPDYGTLRIAALRITSKGDTIQVKVPNYDTTAERSPTVIRKISTVMTPEEQAASQYAREASTKVKNIGDLAAYAFSDYAQLASDARSSARDLMEALAAAADSVRASGGRSIVLTGLPPETRQAATQVEDDLRTTLSWLQELVASSRALQIDLRAVLDARQDPLAFIGAVSRAFESAGTAKTTLARGPGLADSVAAHLRALAAAAPSLDVLTAAVVATAPLNRVVDAYGRLEKVVAHATALVSYGRSLPELAAAFSDDEIRRLKLVSQPVATAPESDILMTKAGGDRAEGDLLVVRAELAAPTGERLATYDWYFQVEKLGWSSRFAAGVGFAGSMTAPNDQALRPIPVLAWVLRDRTRGESGWQRFRNFVDLSPGIHTVTLSTDTQAIQLGVGVSVNLLHDFLQLGLGRKLQPANRDDRFYWYFGLGLFKLAGVGK